MRGINSITTWAALGAIVLGFAGQTQPTSGAVMQAAKFSSYPVPYATPYGIVYDDAGPLKGIWFTNSTLDAKSGAVQFLYKTGKTNFHRTPTAAAQPGCINFVPGSDSLWFTETNGNKIARIDSSRKITEYPVPTPGAKPLDIQHGPDGAMWFCESGVGKIGRIDASTGAITEFVVGAPDDAPNALIAQSGALWFTEVGSGRIGRLMPSGDVTHFSTGSGQLTGDMTNTSDGSIWAPKTTSIVRLRSDGSLTEFPLPGVVKTGAIFGRTDGVFLGAIKDNGQGAIFTVSNTGEVQEYNLPRKYLLPIEFALNPDGGFFFTVRSVPSGHSVSMIWKLQIDSTKPRDPDRQP